MNYTDRNATIGSIAAELPQASIIFGEFGIDYCCGGNRKLQDVIHEQNIDEMLLLAKLKEAEEERKSGYQNTDFTKMSSAALSTYIEDTHHSYLRRVMPEAMELLNTILRVHGKHHPELFEIYRLFGGLKSDLEQHLLKEETIVFPVVADDSSSKEKRVKLTTEIIEEHVAAGEILSKLRIVTNNYSVPEDVCGTFQRTYQLLEEIEGDLHQHIHLENNILFQEYDVR